MDDMRLGTLLLEHRVLAESELERCLEIQELTGGNRPLGQILVDQGVISQNTLDELLELQQSRSRARRLQRGGDENEGFLVRAVKAGATELVISDGRPPIVRIAGELRNLSEEPLGGPEVWQFVREEMGYEVLEEIANQRSVTRNLAVPGMCRGRITAFRHFDGIAALVKIHPEPVRTLGEMGLGGAVAEQLGAGRGLVLLSGGVGSGMTEAMAAMLEEVARTEGRYVMVLDDSFEYPVPMGGAVVVRRQIGVQADSYASALRTASREDADAVFVGDVSDPGAFELALRSAEGGRLVVACLRAPSAVEALQRILDFYPQGDIARLRSSLAAVLRCVVCMQLIPDSGHEDLVPVAEVLMMDGAAREIVREEDLESLDLLLRMGTETGGRSFDHGLLELLRAGRARFEDVLNRADDKGRFLQMAGRREG